MARPPLSAKVLETLRALLADQIARHPGNEYELDEDDGVIYVTTPAHDKWWGIYSATIMDTVVWSVLPNGSTILHKPKTAKAAQPVTP